MPIRSDKSHLLASLLLVVGLFTNTTVMAQEQAADTLNMAEFQHILDSINESNLPDNIKDQLYRDMKTSLIETVRQAEVSEEVKRKLIRDLQSTTR